MEDKMLMEEVLNNTGWTSADAERIFLLAAASERDHESVRIPYTAGTIAAGA